MLKFSSKIPYAENIKAKQLKRTMRKLEKDSEIRLDYTWKPSTLIVRFAKSSRCFVAKREKEIVKTEA